MAARGGDRGASDGGAAEEAENAGPNTAVCYLGALRMPRWVERVRSWRRRAHSANSAKDGRGAFAQGKLVQMEAAAPLAEPASPHENGHVSGKYRQNGVVSSLTVSMRSVSSRDSLSLSSSSGSLPTTPVQNTRCFTASDRDAMSMKLETVLELLTETNGALGYSVAMCQMWLPKRSATSIHSAVSSTGVLHASSTMRRGRCPLHVSFLERAGRVPCSTGVGLAGRVFKSCGVEVLQDIRQAECFPTKKLCEEHSVHSVLGFPIYSKRIPPPPKHWDKKEKRRNWPKPDAVLEVYLDAPLLPPTAPASQQQEAGQMWKTWRQLQTRDLALAGGAPALISRIERLITDAELFIMPHLPEENDPKSGVAEEQKQPKQPGQPESPIRQSLDLPGPPPGVGVGMSTAPIPIGKAPMLAVTASTAA